MRKDEETIGKIRLANINDDMNIIAKLYIYGAEKLVPWIYVRYEYFEKIIFEAVKIDYFLSLTHVFEIDNKIVGLFTGNKHDTKNKKNLKEFRKIVRKYIKGIDYLRYVLRIPKAKVKGPENSFHLSIIAVLEPYRRKGIAGKLLANAEKAAKDMNCDSIFLEVQSDNISAINAYKKYGYHLDHTQPTPKSTQLFTKKDDLKIFFMIKKIK